MRPVRRCLVCFSLGYDALNLGLVTSPAGLLAVVAMPFAGRTFGRGTDARWLIAAGLLVMAVGNYWMSQMNLEINPGQVVWPRVMLVLGLSLCFAPANVAAYFLLQRGRQRGDLDGAHNIGPTRPVSHPAAWRVPRFFQRRCDFLLRSGSGSVPAANRRSVGCAVAGLASTREFAPAASIGTCLFRCVFLMLAVVTLVLVPVVLLMKRSVAEKGAHIVSRVKCICVLAEQKGKLLLG